MHYQTSKQPQTQWEVHCVCSFSNSQVTGNNSSELFLRNPHQGTLIYKGTKTQEIQRKNKLSKKISMK
jgi:hypothetical protein